MMYLHHASTYPQILNFCTQLSQDFVTKFKHNILFCNLQGSLE